MAKKTAFVYRPKLRTVTLPDWPGLEVQTRSVQLDRFIELTALQELQELRDGEMPSPAQVEELNRVYTLFGDQVLASWNLSEPVLDEDGNEQFDESGEVVSRPMPPTADSFRRLDVELANQLLIAWARITAGVSDFLAKRSPDGVPPQMGGIPMEIPSESLPS